MNVLRHIFIVLPALLCVSPLFADTESTDQKPLVAEVLSRAEYLSRKKANLKAKYFMFLRSASWCVPCQMIVPKLMKDYGKMKSAQMELILLGQEDESVVRNYMKEHKYKCPGVMGRVGREIPGLNYEGFGFPSACIVTAEGAFVAKSGGIGMYEWKKQLKAYQTEQRKLRAQEKADQES